MASRLHNNTDKHKYGVDRLSPIGPLRRSHEPAKRHLHRPCAVVRVSVLCVSERDLIHTNRRKERTAIGRTIRAVVTSSQKDTRASIASRLQSLKEEGERIAAGERYDQCHCVTRIRSPIAQGVAYPRLTPLPAPGHVLRSRPLPSVLHAQPELTKVDFRLPPARGSPKPYSPVRVLQSPFVPHDARCRCPLVENSSIANERPRSLQRPAFF